MPLIQDLIELPQQVNRGDFVLRLSEGIGRTDETLRTYVVTPQLLDAFESALGFIRSAVSDRTSKASYLNGSFGSGKSHFMAVLHALLQHSPVARAIPELAPVVAKHQWLEGKKFLLVPYHMIGARSMESAILGGYATYVAKTHPEAPTPGVFLSEPILANADDLRARLGDSAFFDQLSSRNAGGGWGEIAAPWDAASYDRARHAPPGSDERVRLVGDICDTILPAYSKIAHGKDEAFVSLDQGLSIISRHAQALGYDAVVLFLDELILWLASHAAELRFVKAEGQKLSKLVEAQEADRPIPLISFVARQRDLRELVGEHIPGAESLAFAEVLRYWEARFHKITLEDRNLPAIAERRVLKPRDEAARLAIDQAFRQTVQVRQDVFQTLVTTSGDRDMFRQVYPFSPALVQVLVAVSAVLQRERTALKVMVQMLVDGRDRLELGQVVPVGDLFDAIAEGDEAFTEEMRRFFEQARKLYYSKLLPMLEAQHGLRWEDLAALPHNDNRALALRNDARLLKTLILSALVPEVEALKALTPARLAALNHGSIRTPIAGQEAQQVLGKCRQWASQVGEIRIGEGQNPTITLQVTGVDTERILENARVNDNHANRQRKVKELLFEALGVRQEDQLFIHHPFLWRGTARECEVLFANVRELPDESLLNRGDAWKVVIDYPFDAEGRTPADDLARVDRFREAHSTSRTLVWLPSFLSPASMQDLGRLVVLDHVLTGERLIDYAGHLSPADRQSAKALLENQASQLRQKLGVTLEGAYALADPLPGTVDDSAFGGPADHFVSLDPAFVAQPPSAPNLREALQKLLDQALESQFPAHPNFGADELKAGTVRKAWESIRSAVSTTEGRLFVEPANRKAVAAVANPLLIGVMHETHLVLDPHWRDRFMRVAAAPGPLTVGRLKAAIDEPRRMGLPDILVRLLILLFAEQTNRSFHLHGGPFEGTIDRDLPDALELRQQRLPTPEVWEVARRRAAAIFGLAPSPLVNGQNLARLTEDLAQAAQAARAATQELAHKLAERTARLGLDAASCARVRTARTAQRLVEALTSTHGDRLVEAFADLELDRPEETIGRSIASAAEVMAALDQTHWDLLDAAFSRPGGEPIRDRVHEALADDQMARALGPILKTASNDAVALLREPPKPLQPPVEPIDPVVPPVEPQPGTSRGAAKDLDAAGVRRELESLVKKLESTPGAKIDLQWTLKSRR
jgi:hypothetical protein